jgi:hypothetical protein
MSTSPVNAYGRGDGWSSFSVKKCYTARHLKKQLQQETRI